MTGLRERFIALMRRLGASGDAAPAADDLLAAWHDPVRCYHGASHLITSLRLLDQVAVRGAERDTVEAALWFHDAVYDPRGSENERRSAEWADRTLRTLAVPSGTIAEVGRLVLATRHLGPPSDASAGLITDIDLAILGSDRDTFDRYDRNIRAEHAWMPPESYRSARHLVLERFLARHPLFYHPAFRTRFEARARANLGRVVAADRHTPLE